MEGQNLGNARATGSMLNSSANRATQGAEVRSMPASEAMLQRMQMIIERLSNSAVALDNLGNRVFGPNPRDSACDPKPMPPSGIVGLINEKLDSLNVLASFLEDTAQRLNNIA